MRQVHICGKRRENGNRTIQALCHVTALRASARAACRAVCAALRCIRCIATLASTPHAAHEGTAGMIGSLPLPVYPLALSMSATGTSQNEQSACTWCERSLPLGLFDDSRAAFQHAC